ncbi:unnamed protein product [Bursaphelenchus okinawaensis]|uniref:Uncharacterized protein n=1 Tax=Bursaphelenchus okinawaensis TaxID=465554 RepID=A0A811K277_9BILA|nr:unnamed protein product [Bursaphelenchus okinawaensis]CAG9089636.1 unnamed protein product [Bursaphelenchus okinawaensis]
MNFVAQVKEYGKERPKCFCRYFVGTEMHALQQASTAQDRLSQGFWASLIVSFLIISIVMTKNTYGDFLDNQILTTFSIKQVGELEFPSVIMCPKNADALHIHLVYRDIRKRMKNMTEGEMDKLIGYAMADAGFVNMDEFVKNMTDDQHKEKTKLLNQWKGRRTPDKFYRDLFQKFGYKCEEMFKECKLGAEKVPCCQLFKEHYVMLRGRCFRLVKLFQADPDYHGRLYLSMKQGPSPILSHDKMQPQVVAYIAPPTSDVSTFPRYYLNYQSYNYLSASAKNLRLRPDVSSCFPSDERRGKNACYVRRWLYERFITPMNCTPFYMNYRAPWASVCEVGKIAKIYFDIIDVSMNGTKCLPACTRTDRYFIIYTKEHTTWDVSKNVPDFTLEFGYTDLEYEQYEEVLTTTLPGFVSQIGGQLNLFLGVTILSVIQFGLSSTIFIFKKWKGVKHINLHSHLKKR